MTDLEKKMQEGLDNLKKEVTDFTKNSGEKSEKAFKDLEQKMTDLQAKLDEAAKKSEKLDLIDSLTEQLAELDIKLQKKGIQNGAVKSLDEELKAQFEEKGFKDQVEAMKGNSSSAVNFSVKAVTTIMLGSYSGTTLTTEVDRQISSAPKRLPLFRNMVNVGTTRANKVTWVNKEPAEGSAGMTAEGAKKSQVSWTYTEESADVRKITAFVKVSKESLDDLDFLRGEIDNDLKEELELKLDEQISEGPGTGQNLKGILVYAPEFNVTGTIFENSVERANRLDVLRVGIALVRKNRFIPNFAVISPMDAAIMDLEKGEDGHYILPPFVTADGTKIKAVTVVENEAIDEGDFLIGDFSKSNLRVKEEININLGYENDDFTKNLVTILGEMRAVHYIKKHHVKAFVQGTFATAIPEINAAVPVEAPAGV